MFDTVMQFIPESTPALLKDELDTFLDLPCEDVGGDPLGWWSKNRVKYPRLSRMALDYLCAPGMSVHVKSTNRH